MTAYWPPDGDRGPEPRLPRGPARPLIVAALAVAALAIVAVHQRSLAAGSERLRADVRVSEARQRELEAQVARQHASLQKAEDDLEALQRQLQVMEMQLDGVDYLSRELRRELGLPPGAGTWSGVQLDGDPRGGGYAPASVDVERAALARRRLAAGLVELQGLLEEARARGTGATGAAAQPATASPANWPARGTVSSPFGWRWFRSRPNYHTGIDIALPYGTPVAATGDGLVVGSGWQPGFGWSVLVQHAEGYHTLFAHLSETAVRVGDVVAPGSLLGLSGSSGNSTGPHLHYEIWKDGRLLDPRPLMDGTGSR